MPILWEKCTEIAELGIIETNKMIKRYTSGVIKFNFDNGEVVSVLFVDNAVTVINIGNANNPSSGSMKLGTDAFADYLSTIAAKKNISAAGRRLKCRDKKSKTQQNKRAKM